MKHLNHKFDLNNNLPVPNKSSRYNYLYMPCCHPSFFNKLWRNCRSIRLSADCSGLNNILTVVVSQKMVLEVHLINSFLFNYFRGESCWKAWKTSPLQCSTSHRIIPYFMIQGSYVALGNGRGVESVYG